MLVVRKNISVNRGSLLFLALFAVCFSLLAPEGYGSYDFIEYWSAYQLLKSNLNPYDHLELFKLQLSLMPGMERPLMMWNPPWLLALLAPVLEFEFSLAVRIFLALNVLGLVFLFLSPLRMAGTERRKLLLGLVVFLSFYPVWSALRLGQISVLLGVSAVLAITRLSSNPVLTGIALVVLSVKPHLFAPFSVFLLLELYRQRGYGVVVMSLIWFTACVSSVCYLAPSVPLWWFEAVTSPLPETDLLILPSQWKTTTLASFVKVSVWENFGVRFPLMTSLFPIMGMVLAGFVSSGRSIPIFYRGVICLAISGIFSSFGWTFDMIPLLPLVLTASLQSTGCALGVILINLAMLLLSIRSEVGHHHFALFPLAYGVVSALGLRAVWARRESVAAVNAQSAPPYPPREARPQH